MTILGQTFLSLGPTQNFNTSASSVPFLFVSLVFLASAILIVLLLKIRKEKGILPMFIRLRERFKNIAT